MPPIKAYHRPKTVNEVLQLISRSGVNTVVLGGGTCLVPRFPEMANEVVDLQAVGLTEINYTGRGATLGAMVTLQQLVDDSRTPALLRETALLEGPNTLRNAATVGGTVVSLNRESEFLAALLVHEAEVQVTHLGGARKVALTDFLLDVRSALGGGLVTGVSVATMGKTASARVARTPKDRPIVAAVARRDDNGRIHLALCGVANTPILVDPNNVKAAVNPAGDFRGSTEYRRQMAATLARRVLNQL